MSLWKVCIELYLLLVCIKCAGTEYDKRVSFNISEMQLGLRLQNDGVREAGGGGGEARSDSPKIYGVGPEPCHFGSWSPNIIL